MNARHENTLVRKRLYETNMSVIDALGNVVTLEIGHQVTIGILCVIYLPEFLPDEYQEINEDEIVFGIRTDAICSGCEMHGDKKHYVTAMCSTGMFYKDRCSTAMYNDLYSEGAKA